MDSGDAKSESTITNFRSQLSTVADSFLKLAPDQQSEAVKLIQGLQSVLVNHLPINVDPQDTYMLERNQQIATFLFHNLNNTLGEGSDSDVFNQEEKPNIRSSKEMCIQPSPVPSHFVTEQRDFVNASRRSTSNIRDEHLNITAQSFKPPEHAEKHDTAYSSTQVENLSVLQFDSQANNCLMTKNLEVSEAQTQILSQNASVSYKSMDAESIKSSQTKNMPTFSVCDIGPTDAEYSNCDVRASSLFQNSCNMSTQSSHKWKKFSRTN
ncbi:uncharacterized protein LOC106462235 [Limulus polyphemus]|uniref:Uncharacterized protein LOC106462235 n=1 Tax=Limulus polyphemus TaxID=6850 RepID=A0ABM1SNC9_LIMPO|nr:uncharacterized protein LOC106462235 [Limulus polyphemus]